MLILRSFLALLNDKREEFTCLLLVRSDETEELQEEVQGSYVEIQMFGNLLGTEETVRSTVAECIQHAKHTIEEFYADIDQTIRCCE